jgi:hypothetical protein
MTAHELSLQIFPCLPTSVYNLLGDQVVNHRRHNQWKTRRLVASNYSLRLNRDCICSNMVGWQGFFLFKGYLKEYFHMTA